MSWPLWSHERLCGGAGLEQQPLDFVDRLGLRQRGAHARAEPAAAQVPAVELAQPADGALGGHLARHLAHEAHELADQLLVGRHAGDAVDQLGQQPGVALGAARDHHGARARRVEHFLGARAVGDVAGGHHGDVDEVDEFGRQGVVGPAGVHLLCRAGVERDRLGTRVDQLWAEHEAVARAVAHAGPQLDRHGDGDGLGDRARDGDRHVVVVERRGARAGLRDLAHRAAEVDVDDVGAGGLAHARGLGDRGRIRSEDLHREGMLVAGDAQVAERARVAVREAAGRDHLRAHEARAEAASLPPEGLHGDSRHRREHDARGNLHLADLERRREIESSGGESGWLHGATQCTLRSGAVETHVFRAP